MSAGELLKQANQLKRSGKLDEAIALYHQVIDINPHFAWAYHGLGDALAKQGNKEHLIKYYLYATKIGLLLFWGRISSVQYPKKFTFLKP
ncbi:tetratricopeptide repeat protein [Limnospira fusiformis KN01]|uniref:tetratricopeptide repeat protein n=1 Tax=Limnospira fusiformis TaxID=54297 RepID=UPI001F470803|nr:tetratricopeptide repeat protein [Limnospira fusiformis]ULB48403.1 tetratricopeptide repeat protein [Limnospira fusiformis KN01]